MADDAVVRTFLAIDLPESLRKEIGKIQDYLRPLCRGVRWVRPEGIHLTLKFFGNLSGSEIRTASGVISRAAALTSPFSLGMGTPGVFPGIRRPRVLWIGVEGDTDALMDLQRKIERDLETVGFRRESRPFRPHLTLGRFREPEKIDELERALKGVADIRDTESFTASGLTLFKSDLKPGGAVYKSLEFFPFPGR